MKQEIDLTNEKSYKEVLNDLIKSLEQLENSKNIIFNRLNASFSKSVKRLTNLKSRIIRINKIIGSFSSINKSIILSNAHTLIDKIQLSFASQLNDITNDLIKATSQVINIRKNLDDFEPILYHVKKDFTYENTLNMIPPNLINYESKFETKEYLQNIFNNNQKSVNACNNIHQPQQNTTQEKIVPKNKTPKTPIVPFSSLN